MLAAQPQSGLSLIDTLDSYIEDLAEEDRPDALHQVFYGFATRLAVIDRATHELATHAGEDAVVFEKLGGGLGEALTDNGLFVGQELFTSRVRTMSAMSYVSRRLREALGGEPPQRAFTVTHAIAFDDQEGRLRSYALDVPSGHPDLPYDALAYDVRPD